MSIKAPIFPRGKSPAGHESDLPNMAMTPMLRMLLLLLLAVPARAVGLRDQTAIQSTVQRDPTDEAVVTSTVRRLCFHCIRSCLHGRDACEHCVRGCVPLSIAN